VVVNEPSKYTITVITWEGGSITPPTTTVNAGASQTFTITPDEGYHIADVLVDGVSVGPVSEYTFTDITTNHTIEAFFSPVSSGGSFLRDDWRDENKSPTNPDDDWMCWAFAAANILDVTGWGAFDSVQDIVYTFQNYWTNAGSLMKYAWNWWFDGTEPPDWPGWAQLNEGWSQAEGGGTYWSDYNFFDYFYEDWALWDSDSNQWSSGYDLMTAIDAYLHNDFGVTLAAYSDGGGHALSVWGYEYDEYGNYTGIWVTDSDDELTGLKLLSVTFDFDEELWYLDVENLYGYSDWIIGGVQALDAKPEGPAIPESGTLIFFSVGLIWMFVLKRRRLKRK
jgi:hypothetical protein